MKTRFVILLKKIRSFYSTTPECGRPEKDGTEVPSAFQITIIENNISLQFVYPVITLTFLRM